MSIKRLLKGSLTSIFDQLREMNKGIPDEKWEELMTKVKTRVNQEPPPHIAIIGETGVGKSSTLNALFNAGRGISHTEAFTQEEAAIEVSVSQMQGEESVLWSCVGSVDTR